ncbi:hypothetical protein WME76_39500 [Sorangium sp. So ce119]|uniref:hypothetical protein n=1 Tax=Sorangium sp. So ce119 TaxID=3133279 RepID=UPI003F625959
MTAETATGRPFALWLEGERWVVPAGEDRTGDFFNRVITPPSGARCALDLGT